MPRQALALPSPGSPRGGASMAPGWWRRRFACTAGVKVDVADGGALFEAEGHGCPLEVAWARILAWGSARRRYRRPWRRAGDGPGDTGPQYGGDTREHGLASSFEGLASSDRIPLGTGPATALFGKPPDGGGRDVPHHLLYQPPAFQVVRVLEFDVIPDFVRALFPAFLG